MKHDPHITIITRMEMYEKLITLYIIQIRTKLNYLVYKI